jgi:tetratricopeptide (TPR) repeat protein
MPRRPSTHVDSPAAVGERLRAARRAAGLSQRDLSFDGCTAAYVSRIEAGARTPSYQILREFAKRLGVTADYLATGDEGLVVPDALLEAEIALRLGELDRAEAIYAGATGDATAEARAWAGLGSVALARGDLRDAIERLARALESGLLPGEEAAATAERLGRAYCLQGQFDEAFAILERFLEEARSRRDRFATARFCVLLANAHVDAGNLATAESVLTAALADAKHTIDPLLRADLYWSQSRLCLADGKSDLAAEYAELAAATLRTTEHAAAAARALLLQAQIENARGNSHEALAHIEEATPELDCVGDEVEQACLSIERARALAALGEGEQALSLMLGAVARLDQAQPAAAAPAYASAADFYRKHGDDSRALELYELAVERAPAPGRHVADALTAMAEIHEEQGRADEALRLLKSALASRSGVAAVG